jgi:hypothetical protein
VLFRSPRFSDLPENQPIYYWPVETKQHGIFTSVNLQYRPPHIGPGALIRHPQSLGEMGGLRVASERTTANLAEYLNGFGSLEMTARYCEAESVPTILSGRPDPRNVFRLSEEETWARFLFLPRSVPIPQDPYENRDPVETMRMIQSYHLDWAVLNGEITSAQAKKAWALLSDVQRLNTSPIQAMIPTGDVR